MYNVRIDNLLKNYIVNVVDYVHCITTTHFLFDEVTITQTVSPLSSTTYIYIYIYAIYMLF